MILGHRPVHHAHRVVLLVLMLGFVLVSPVLPAASDRTIVVGLYDVPPKISFDSSGRPAGIYVELLEDLARKEGWRLQYVVGSWVENLDRLERGEIDLMPGIGLTEERARSYSFSQIPVLSSWFQVFAAKWQDIHSLMGLNGKRVLVLARSTPEQALIRLARGFELDVTILAVPDYPTMFAKIANGEADAIIANRYQREWSINKYHLIDTEILFEPTALYYAVPKGDPKQLLGAIDQYLAALKANRNSFYYDALKRLAAESTPFTLPPWLMITGGGLLGFLLVSIAIGMVFKHQVNVRTGELRRENAERRALQQRFMDIIDFLPDPTFVIDEHKRVIAWSKACEAMTGVKKDQVIGQGDYAYAEALFGQRRPILIDLLDQFDSSVEASYTLLYRMEDRICGEFFLSDPGGGQKKYLWGVASPLYDQEGRRSGAIEAIRNITERRQAEEKIRLLNEDLRRHAETLELRVAERMAELTAVNEEQRAIFESAGAGILLITGRVIQRCNRKFEEITGYSQGELIGQSARILYQDEESFTGLTREVYNQLTRGEVCCKEQQIVRKDGSLFWARLRLCACDVHVPFGGMVGIFEDITAEREAKEQLCQALENAQEADRAKSVFLASISHELRTPLNSIIGFVGAILQELAGPLNPEQCKQLGMVRKSARHLLALINDVLDISKINAGELELDCRSFSLKGSIEKVVKLIAPLAEQKGIELRMVIDGEIEEIVGDQRRLEQVMLNLLNNAVKFTEKGRVSIACRRDDDGYSLAVTDTGIGMPADKMPNLFTPFYQIDSGLARKHEGTGLGLSICKKIVDMMGGTITVASEWGQGSIFTVRLPGRTQGVRSE